MAIPPAAARKYGILAAALVLAVLAPPGARAALGQSESTIAADMGVLKGSVKSTAHTNYRVHEIDLPTGTVVREFATLDGTVFAVAWRGPTIPNLQQTLGSYFDTFVAAAKESPGRRHHLDVRRDNFIMQSNGHMRAFSGRAYLPQAVPPGVSVDELQ
jgi:hypothetical protein